jgi:septum formation protein
LKAVVVAGAHPDALVLAADTVVSLGAEHFAKPGSLGEAEEMLVRLEGRTHQVVTGVVLLHARLGRRRMVSDTTSVTFRRLNRVDIRRYHERMNPLDKAGGYAIQDGGEAIVESVRGSFSNVVGLPVELLREELEAWPGRCH